MAGVAYRIDYWKCFGGTRLSWYEGVGISTALPSWIPRRLSVEFQLIEISSLHLISIGGTTCLRGPCIWTLSLWPARAVHLDSLSINLPDIHLLGHLPMTTWTMPGAWLFQFPLWWVALARAGGGISIDYAIVYQSWYVKFAQKLGLSSGSIVKNLA